MADANAILHDLTSLTVDIFFKKHVLICDERKDTSEDRDLRNEKPRKTTPLPLLSMNIWLSFHAEICDRTTIGNQSNHTSDPVNPEKGIYFLQTILMPEEPFNIFLWYQL